jgi:NifU-like protein
MWNYSQKMMDHFLNPRNAGELPDPDGVGQVGSIVCGDSLKLTIKVDPETKRITDARFLTFGCGSAIASASALTEIIKGKTLNEALEVTDDQLAEYLDGLPPEKMHCSVMGTDAVRAAVADYRGEPPPESHLHEEDIVCHCFGVTRQKIEDIVRRHGLVTVEQVTQYTKAGGGCGRCKPKIEDIIASVRAEAEPARPERRMTNLQRIRKIEEALEREIRPAIRADGGDIELVDVDGTRVVVGLRGRCVDCQAAGVTLHKVVESRLRELVDPAIEIVEEE